MNLQYVNPRKNPPPFSSLRNYEQWKKEINAWTRLTTEVPENWAHLVALGSLSEDDPSGIREKVFALDLDPDPAQAAIAAEDGQAAAPARPADQKAGWNRLIALALALNSKNTK